jgi:hypothetical protein
LGGQLAEGWRQMPRKLEPDLSPSKLWLIRHYRHGPEMSISPYVTGTRESQKNTGETCSPCVKTRNTRGWVHGGHYTGKSVFLVCSMISTGKYLYSPVSKATHGNLLFPRKSCVTKGSPCALGNTGEIDIFIFLKKS